MSTVNRGLHDRRMRRASRDRFAYPIVTPHETTGPGVIGLQPSEEDQGRSYFGAFCHLKLVARRPKRAA